MADTKIWWKKLECHYNPSWKLHEIQKQDLNKLKVHVERDILNEFMVVERLLYAAFLEVPVGSLYNNSFPSVSKACKYLTQAEKYVEDTYEMNEDAKVGYGIVINACRMWINRSTRKWEEKLEKLQERSKEYPKSQYYMTAVRAFALSRLGPEWLKEALKYYEIAIKGIPENSHWLLETASLYVQLVLLEDQNGELEDSVRWLTFSERLVTQALQYDKTFYAARALLVQILSSQGRVEEANKEAKELNTHLNKVNVAMTNIAEILCKFYIDKGQQRKATGIISKVPQKQRAAQGHFLRGSLHKWEAEHYADRQNKWKSASRDADKALKVDARHYPSLRLKAETSVGSGHYEDAKTQYADLLDSNLLDQPHLYEDKFCTLASVLGYSPEVIKEILTDEERIIYSSDLLTVAISAYLERNDDSIAFSKFAKGHVEKCKSFLKEMCEREDDFDNSFLAKLKLAHFHLQLKQYEDARSLYRDLKSKTSRIFRENVEVMWGLFKCDLGERLYESAEKLVKDMGKKQTFYRINELQADIYTTRARSELAKLNDKSAEVVFSKDDDDPSSIARSLEQAIENGSLEACFMFFTIDNLRKHFLEFMRIPRIVAKIQRVNNEEKENVHTDFPIERYVTDRECSITSKRSILKEYIEELLTACESKDKGFTAYQNFTINNIYKKLSKLRKNLLKFEVVAAKKSEGTFGDEEFEDVYSLVLLTARFLLDHITSDYQDALIKDDGNKPNSYFCFIYDHKNGTVTDKERATSKLDDWLKSKFPKCHAKVSDEVKKSLLEMQPMYDINKNRWLVDINYYVNTLKHQGGRKRKKEPTTETDETALSDLTKDENKENLARKSCKEVEKIVLQILDEIKEIYKSANQEE